MPPASTSRSSSLAAAATTLVALVAVAAATPTGPVCLPGTMPGEAMLAGESKAVRAVAAVVAAVARDLLATGHVTAGLPALPAPGAPDLSARRLAGSPAPARAQTRRMPRLAARLLDLPPPGV